MTDGTPTAGAPSESACRAEIERLHDAFVAWYTATVEEGSFDRIGDALGPDFEMVTPDEDRVGRAAVLDSIREQYGRDAPGAFDIEISNVERRDATDERATVRYEEWQAVDGETTGRVSTVSFRVDPTAPGGLLWLDVHETWLD